MGPSLHTLPMAAGNAAATPSPLLLSSSSSYPSSPSSIPIDTRTHPERTSRHMHTYIHTEELYTFAQFKPRGSRSGYRAIPVPGRPTPLSPRLLALTPSNSWQPHKLYLYLILARLSPQPAPGPVLYNFTCLHPLQTLAAQSLKHRGSESGVGRCWVWGIRRGSKTRRIRQSGIDANGH